MYAVWVSVILCHPSTSRAHRHVVEVARGKRGLQAYCCCGGIVGTHARGSAADSAAAPHYIASALQLRRLKQHRPHLPEPLRTGGRRSLSAPACASRQGWQQIWSILDRQLYAKLWMSACTSSGAAPKGGGGVARPWSLV